MSDQPSTHHQQQVEVVVVRGATDPGEHHMQVITTGTIVETPDDGVPMGTATTAHHDRDHGHNRHGHNTNDDGGNGGHRRSPQLRPAAPPPPQTHTRRRSDVVSHNNQQQHHNHRHRRQNDDDCCDCKACDSCSKGCKKCSCIVECCGRSFITNTSFTIAFATIACGLLQIIVGAVSSVNFDAPCQSGAGAGVVVDFGINKLLFVSGSFFLAETVLWCCMGAVASEVCSSGGGGDYRGMGIGYAFVFTIIITVVFAVVRFAFDIIGIVMLAQCSGMDTALAAALGIGSSVSLLIHVIVTPCLGCIV